VKRGVRPNGSPVFKSGIASRADPGAFFRSPDKERQTREALPDIFINDFLVAGGGGMGPDEIAFVRIAIQIMRARERAIADRMGSFLDQRPGQPDRDKKKRQT
jgi:hypothetical protein